MNTLYDCRDAFDGLKPWSGFVPRGFIVDFLGTLTALKFRRISDLDRHLFAGGNQTTELPSLRDGTNGEGWFEAINWLSAAREARGRFVIMSLGAHYGAQLVGAHQMLQRVNPLPCTLVGVEAEPGNYTWISEHMRDNGINPEDHWLVPMAIADTNKPVLFPVGSSGVGSNNCFATNSQSSRKIYAELIIRDGDANAALRSLLVDNTTGFTQPVHPDLPDMTEIKLVSAVTLDDILGPFDRVDYVEADIQQSEVVVFPPFMPSLRKKVRRIHIGTHGVEAHTLLHRLFVENGWEIVFSFEPNAQHQGVLGQFLLNDGILTVINPDLRS